MPLPNRAKNSKGIGCEQQRLERRPIGPRSAKQVEGQKLKILVTGGAGFIGSALVRHLIAHTRHGVVNVDKLTYAGNPESLLPVTDSPLYVFEQADIVDAGAVAALLDKHRPDAIMHLAAESHVDRSIDGPAEFVQTNIVGTYVLLDACLRYWRALEGEAKAAFRFLHISTDEVYGDLGSGGGLFTEDTPYDPSSPYSASKAASDHLVRAWGRTYGLPVLITNCSNNYGPYQFPEKLIPLMILNAIEGKPLPVYGEGLQVRDWLYVEDHVRALLLVLAQGSVGRTYNIGGLNEMRNIDVVRRLCETLERLRPDKPAGIVRYEDLVTYVTDRPGHDARYAIDADRIGGELGWAPQESFETGLEKTVRWYLDNPSWCAHVQDGSYSRGRLGLTGEDVR